MNYFQVHLAEKFPKTVTSYNQCKGKYRNTQVEAPSFDTGVGFEEVFCNIRRK